MLTQDAIEGTSARQYRGHWSAKRSLAAVVVAVARPDHYFVAGAAEVQYFVPNQLDCRQFHSDCMSILYLVLALHR